MKIFQTNTDLFMKTKKATIVLTLTFAAACLLIIHFTLYTSTPSVERQLENVEGFECTTGLISGEATVDGRPILWKSRDVRRWEQEFHFYDETPYDFIGVTYAGVDTQCWGGINEAGFAIENSNGLNLGSVTGPDDDGLIQYLALATCERVSDFASILDSTNLTSRTRPSIYGVFDRFGAGGMFECRSTSYVFFDINDTTVAPEGILVRSNFGYTGGTSHVGQFRHDRALEILQFGASRDIIDSRFVHDYVGRDIANSFVNPYPLPYTGFLVVNGDTVWGGVKTHNAINREFTSSAFLVQGIRPGENPLTSTIWVQVGEPTMTPMLPLWVAAGSVPVEVDSDTTSPICDRAKEFWDFLYHFYPSSPDSDIIDTRRLVDGQGGGLLHLMRILEGRYYGRVQSIVDRWRTNFPAQGEVASLQNRIASTVYQLMLRYDISTPVDITERRREGQNLLIMWPRITRNALGDEMSVKGYSVYHSEHPYDDIEAAEFVGFTGDTLLLVDTGEFLESGYFMVIAEPEGEGFAKGNFDWLED